MHRAEPGARLINNFLCGIADYQSKLHQQGQKFPTARLATTRVATHSTLVRGISADARTHWRCHNPLHQPANLLAASNVLLQTFDYQTIQTDATLHGFNRKLPVQIATDPHIK